MKLKVKVVFILALLLSKQYPMVIPVIQSLEIYPRRGFYWYTHVLGMLVLGLSYCAM